MDSPTNTRSAWAVYAALLFGTFITIEAAAFQAPALPSVTRHFGIRQVPAIVSQEGQRLRIDEMVLEKQAEYGYAVMNMEIMPEHVHLLLDVDPRVGVNNVVAKIKGYTSHELREEYPWLKKRLPTLWTRSKFISSVGAVTLDTVQRYIADQRGV